MPSKSKVSAKKPTIDVATAFHEAQLSLAKHRKCAEALRALRTSIGAEAFDKDFFECVACVLPVYKREPAAERVVEFVVSFATKHGDGEHDDEFVQTFLTRLLRLTSAKDKAVRFRVAQLVGRIMNSMAEEAEVSDELFDAVEVAMLARCHDKVPVVRAMALRALFRLQDPTSASCGITAELLRLMSEDPSKEVRMAAISTIAPSKHAIRAILLRVRDTSPEVRLHALGVLRDKVEMRWLSISQRVSLLEGTLADRTPAVASACADMLCGSWLRKGCNGDVLALIKALDVVSHENVVGLALKTLLTREQPRALVAKSAKQSWDGLQPEAAFCLRAYLAHLASSSSSSAASELESAAPELPDFCAALRRAAAACTAGSAEGLASTCTFAHLLRACEHLDMTNEHGRASLEELLCEQLKCLGTADELLPHLFCALGAACVGEKARFQRLVTELMAEVEDPLEGDEAEATDVAEADARLERVQEAMFAQARLGELREEVAERVAEEDFEAAAALKKEAAELSEKLAELEAAGGESPESVLARSARCLRLAALLLQAPSLELAAHDIAPLPARFLPALQSPHVEIRELGVKCLGLHCHLSAAHAKSFFPLFVKAAHHDQPRVQLAALRSILDLLLLHSPAAVLGAAAPLAPDAEAEAPAEDEAAVELGPLLLPLLTQPAGELRTTAALGLCKLFHAGALRSDILLSRLVLIYFECSADEAADAADAATLSQTLAVFFAALGEHAGIGRTLLPAVRSVLGADSGSPDASVPLDRLMSFVLALARPDGDAASALHIELAISLCCECLLSPEGREGRVLPKAFPHIVLPSARTPAVEILGELVGRLAAELTDKAAARHVQKMRERIGEMRQPSRASDEAVDAASVDAVLEAYGQTRDADNKRVAVRSSRRESDASEARPMRRKLGTTKSAKSIGATPVKGLEDENVTMNAIAIS